MAVIEEKIAIFELLTLEVNIYNIKILFKQTSQKKTHKEIEKGTEDDFQITLNK